MDGGAPANLNLLLTYRCNLRCRHCISNCGPDRARRMSYEQARGYIDETCATTRVASIGYTGGEPFLVYSLLCRLMRHVAFRYGVPQGVVTNCSWAKNAEFTRSQLQKLCGCGLRFLTVSCDDFHLEYVGADRIRRVVHTALDLGLGVTVNITLAKNCMVNRRVIPGLLGLTHEALERVCIKELSPLRIGRASQYFGQDDLIGTVDEECWNGRCRFVMSTPTIAPNGAVFACCCFGDADEDSVSRIGYAGNLDDDGATAVFSGMYSNLLFHLLARRGPYALLQLDKNTRPELSTLGRYLTNCEICVELHSNPEVRSALAGVLHELAASD